MSKILETAKQFFEACETGKGWYGCSEYCHPEATFSAQAGALADIATLEAYAEWMKGLLTPVPDGHYELRFFAEVRSVVVLHIRRLFRNTYGRRRPCRTYR